MSNAACSTFKSSSPAKVLATGVKSNLNRFILCAAPGEWLNATVRYDHALKDAALKSGSISVNVVCRNFSITLIMLCLNKPDPNIKTRGPHAEMMRRDAAFSFTAKASVNFGRSTYGGTVASEVFPDSVLVVVEEVLGTVEARQ